MCSSPCAVLSNPERRQQYDLALLDYLDVEVRFRPLICRRLVSLVFRPAATCCNLSDVELIHTQDYLSRYTEFLLTPNGLGMTCSRPCMHFHEHQLMIAT